MTRDANEIAREYERKEEWEVRHQPTRPTQAVTSIKNTPRYGRMIGALTEANNGLLSASDDAELRWDDVSVQPFSDGFLLLEDRSGVRTIVNLKEFVFLEFRPDDEGE